MARPPDTGRSGFRFHQKDVGDLLHTFVISHIRDLDDQRYYYNLHMATTKPEGLSQAISMVVNLPKAVKIRFFSATSAPTRSLSFLESCLLWILNTIRKSRRRRTMLWSSYTRTLLRCSRCFFILPSRVMAIKLGVVTEGCKARSAKDKQSARRCAI